MLQHYEEFRDYLQEICGIMLGDNKQYLVTSRIGHIMSDNHLDDLSELVVKMKSQPRSGLHQLVIEAMTTNETLWFRDAYPYEILKEKVMPELQRTAHSQRLKIWSAACSSGQEPYSISMIVEEYKREHMGVLKKPVDIIATDLSRKILELAQRGEYDQSTIERGLSPERQHLFFDKRDNCWVQKNFVKERVSFQALNLLDSYSLLGKFDVVCCRNVLIYFSAKLKADILTRMHGALKPGGYLFLGASETLGEASKLYEMVQCNPGIVFRAL